MPKVYIDGIEYEAEAGKNMLEVALDYKLNLPYFCWHPAMHSVGSCRQCAVKVFKDESDQKGKIMMACMTPALEGTRISIDDPDAVEFRRYVIEWLMTNHPHDCPVCDEGGECHLQDMTAMTGHIYRRFRGRKRTYNNQYLGPFVNHEMNRCIQCWRCVRFYRDMAGGRDFGVFGSRNRVYFGRQKDGVLESEFSGNLVEVCPTGVFTDKTLMKNYTRKWDLETAPSICIHCGLGCNTIPGARYGILRRIRAKYNPEVNGYFICDRGRYGYEFENHQARIRNLDTDSIRHARDLISNAKRVIGIGSARASLESNYALRKLVGKESFSTGLSSYEQTSVKLALDIMLNSWIHTPSLAEVPSADVVLILGADPTNEAPMLDYAIRQAMNRARLDISRALKIPDWDAHAVQNALQGEKGKLYAAAPWEIKLQEIAAHTTTIDFEEVACFASDIAESIANGIESDELPSKIAQSLSNANQPLIVTSISAGTEVLKMAANLAQALKDKGKSPWLTIIMPEANTLGVAMLGGMSVDDALSMVESGEADTLLILENDLSMRIDADRLESAMSKAKTVVFDCIQSKTSERAAIVLPIPSCIETNGTFVNNEGRAQRFYQVFDPRDDILHPWELIQELIGTKTGETLDDVVREMASEIPVFSHVTEAAPLADWRSSAGQKVARMPHRFSGRTAKDANTTINEPVPKNDSDTPLAFSMDGDQNPVPAAIEPRFWWPGWNSINSVTKFQIEVNGPLHGGNPGKRLIEANLDGRLSFPASETAHKESDQVWLIPRRYIFGSDELSRYSTGIRELSPPDELHIHPALAASYCLADGDDAEFEAHGQLYKLPVRLDNHLAHDVVTVPFGFDAAAGIIAPQLVRIARCE